VSSLLYFIACATYKIFTGVCWTHFFLLSLAAVTVEEMQAHVKLLFEKVHIRTVATGNVYKDVSNPRFL
jgi:hypothetical protein